MLLQLIQLVSIYNTAGVDGSLRVWDLRTYREALTPSMLDLVYLRWISQRGVLAVGHGPRVTIWKDLLSNDSGSARVPYMNHLLPGQTVTSVQFCPFEDVWVSDIPVVSPQSSFPDPVKPITTPLKLIPSLQSNNVARVKSVNYLKKITT